MPINIFLSVGRPFNPQQELFIDNIETFLGTNGLRPRTVGRTEFTYKQPLQLVDALMDRSAGALVIALERIDVVEGRERGGPPLGTRISGEAIATPWNQIEAALAYSKRIPLLVIRQSSVRAEGLLEGRYDWYVHVTDLDSGFLGTKEFKGTFNSWVRDVRGRAGWFGCRR